MKDNLRVALKKTNKLHAHYYCFQELSSLKEGSSGESDELKAELASTKEALEADIKNKEQVETLDGICLKQTNDYTS